MLLQFGYPITLHGAGWAALYMLLYAGMIVFGLLVVRGERDHVLPGIAVGAAFVFFGLWVAWDPGHPTALTGMFVTVALFQGGVMYSLLKFVYRRSSTPGLELILAAVSVYLLLGGMFSAVFSVTELHFPGSFTDGSHPGEPMVWQQFMYYSYITMSTLGYGDILPVTPWARSLAAVETVAATLFLTTVIARLVGVYTGAGARAESQEGGAG
ncbi:potassium channel family protein [Nocardiopsis sp. YSL2]|uniref:potassium channel family protein n=1 Tax=Nocardiopsis sp. YSL2 TaxID=2939492 RepID=UPI0026F46F17|nr:potassium channel family protein [Nocardiopsis sp. YSL2]